MKLGRTGEEISSIGFGAMHLSIQGRPPEDVGRQVLHAALDNGITFIDTADSYCLDDSDVGHNERLIAAVLKERSDREKIKVGTKGGIRRPKGAWTNDGTPKHIRQACEQSLRSLGADQIFLYQFHAPDPAVPFEKSVEAFAQLQRDGKCRYVGLSNVSVSQIEKAAGIVDVASVQNKLSPFFRDAVEDGVVAECERRGITFIAYSPVGGFRRSKKVPSIGVLSSIANRRGVSPHAVCLAWVRAKGTTVAPIPGATKPEHAADSARASALTLTPAEVAEIDNTEFSRL